MGFVAALSSCFLSIHWYIELAAYRTNAAERRRAVDCLLRFARLVRAAHVLKSFCAEFKNGARSPRENTNTCTHICKDVTRKKITLTHIHERQRPTPRL